ncbi:DUF1707 SHOCT-like domain-containing protein [Microlunatus flavus]|uniref:DUF1707 domain-containing protein n=1 Tax=Microlunatus flavus TaxID=1036181 RepID=A0A1H8ZF88_9ACTN|nr:DUF1707 domain-containing protein [Microlunatus flavus]SEP62867.1 protein of unknown function [Microlunatus flavus]
MDQLTPYSHRPSPTRPLTLGPGAALRVGEVERAAACDALADHYAAGRLDPAELDDRLARAMAARSQGDLRVLFADLGPRRTPPPALRAEPAEPVETRPSGALVPLLAAVMVMALLVAGGMLMVLGAYNPALFVGALVGGTATAVAGVCGTVVARTTWRRR